MNFVISYFPFELLSFVLQTICLETNMFMSLPEYICFLLLYCPFTQHLFSLVSTDGRRLN
jgi:hypothetical protein